MKEIYNRANDFVLLMKFYLLKLFSIRNLLLITISFFCFYATSEVFIKIFNENTSLFFYNKDYIQVIVFSIWLTLIVNYFYLYLKKNNFTNVDDYKNTFSNTVLTFLIMASGFITLYLSIIHISDYHNRPGSMDEYVIVVRMFILFFLLNLIELFFVSLFSSKNSNYKKIYIILISYIVFEFIFFLWFETRTLDGATIMNAYSVLILKILLSLILILVSLNIGKRMYRIKSKS